MNDGIKAAFRGQIIDILSANDRVQQVILFGSRAMGTYSPESDVDLALFGDKLTLTDLAELAAAIEALPIAQKVDLLLWQPLENDNLKTHIRQYGVVWYNRS